MMRRMMQHCSVTVLGSALALVAVGCEGGQTAPDGGPDAGSDELDAGGSGSDAGADAFFLDGGPDAGTDPLVWRTGDCDAVVARGVTGDRCSGEWSCFGVRAMAECNGTAGILVVVELEATPACSAPAAAPWSDCTAALTGDEGQRCEGTWGCAAVDVDRPCCAEVALCNPTFGTGFYPEDQLLRTRVCNTLCELEPSADRPTWTECPPAWTSGAPDPTTGDPCSGTWACVVGRDRFGRIPGGLTTEVPVWCDGQALHVAPSAATLADPAEACE